VACLAEQFHDYSRAIKLRFDELAARLPETSPLVLMHMVLA
jgi:hypothetical protein